LTQTKTRTKGKKKWLILGAVALVLAVLGYRGFAMSRAPRILTADTAEIRPIESYIATSGRIDQGELREYYIGTTTTVDTVHFKRGDLVKAGDLIVRFDHTQTLANLELAELAYERVRLSIKDAEIQYFNAMDDLADLRYDLAEARKQRDRYYDNYNTTGDPADRARYEYYYDMADSYEKQVKARENTVPTDEAIQILTIQLEEARLNYETARREVEKLPANIVAPFDGVIEILGVTDYGTVQKGVLACAIRRTENNVVVFNVGRYDFPHIELGQSVAVTVGRNRYTGSVSQIGSVASEGNTVEIEVTVDNPDQYFIPGLEADLDVLIYQSDDQLTLPIEAVKSDRTGRYCYVLTPIPESEGLYKPVRTRITAGHSSDLYIEVLEGLEPGAMVVRTIPADIDYITQCLPELTASDYPAQTPSQA
jgi:HlyD family secretion protein